MFLNPNFNHTRLAMIRIKLLFLALLAAMTVGQTLVELVMLG